MTQPHPVNDLVDIAAIAQRLGVQVRHVRRLVHERRIPYIKWGHLIRFDPADIEAWLENARFDELAGERGDRRVTWPMPTIAEVEGGPTVDC